LSKFQVQREQHREPGGLERGELVAAEAGAAGAEPEHQELLAQQAAAGPENVRF